MEGKATRLLLTAVFCAAVLAGCGKSEKIFDAEAVQRPSDGSADAAQEEKWAMIPMVMVDGELYLDTGYESDTGRCGLPDGKITSSVGGSGKPVKDDQHTAYQ